jgi:hypothetical protein
METFYEVVSGMAYAPINFWNLSSEKKAEMASDTLYQGYNDAKCLIGKIGKIPEYVAYNITDNQGVYPILKEIKEGNEKIINETFDNFAETLNVIVELTKKIQVNSTENCLALELSFSENNGKLLFYTVATYFGKIEKVMHNLSHAEDQVVSLKQLLISPLFRKLLINKMIENNTACEGVKALQKGHSLKVSNILSTIELERDVEIRKRMSLMQEQLKK